MERIVINGQKRLSGEVYINGAKNAAVAVIPAAIAANGISVIENLPHVEDVKNLIDVISTIGAVCEFRDEHTLVIDSRNVNDYRATHESAKKLRGSYYLIGALLGRFKKAEVTMPGGCDFGDRPIDQHIKGFEALGAKIKIEYGVVKAEVKEGGKLVGANIYLDVVSVGATINIMLAAVYAEGTTIIENAAKEPHVVDTANFLNLLGAKIKGAGTDIIRITGVESLHGSEYTIIPDQIETGTYMIAAAATGGDVTVRNIIPKHMDSLSAKLKEMNCKVQEGDDFIRVVADGQLNCSNIKTMVYPGFPTDLHPPMSVLLCLSKGSSIITDTIYDSRFGYVTGLKRLGANITIEGRTAIIQGDDELTGTEVEANDLRAGAAFIIAGLVSKGCTSIGNVKYIDRGYEDFETKFRALGADISRISVAE